MIVAFSNSNEEGTHKPYQPTVTVCTRVCREECTDRLSSDIAESEVLLDTLLSDSATSLSGPVDEPIAITT